MRWGSCRGALALAPLPRASGRRPRPRLSATDGVRARRAVLPSAHGAACRPPPRRRGRAVAAPRARPRSGAPSRRARAHARRRRDRPPTFDARAGRYADARRLLRKLAGTRRRALRPCSRTSTRSPRAATLTASRLPALFETVARNRQWWASGPLLRYGQRVSFAAARSSGSTTPARGCRSSGSGRSARQRAVEDEATTPTCARCSTRLSLAARAPAGSRWSTSSTSTAATPPWASGLAQGTGDPGAVARRVRLTRAALLRGRALALGIFRTAPPSGVRVATEHGAHYLSTRSRRRCACSTPSRRRSTACTTSRCSPTTRGPRAVRGRRGELRVALPAYDTGAWSRYSLHTEADLGYHKLARDFLVSLCTRLQEDAARGTDAPAPGSATSGGAIPIRRRARHARDAGLARRPAPVLRRRQALDGLPQPAAGRAARVRARPRRQAGRDPADALQAAYVKLAVLRGSGTVAVLNARLASGRRRCAGRARGRRRTTRSCCARPISRATSARQGPSKCSRPPQALTPDFARPGRAVPGRAYNRPVADPAAHVDPHGLARQPRRHAAHGFSRHRDQGAQPRPRAADGAGDRIVLYLTKVMRFAASIRITGELYEDREKIWPGKPGKADAYPWRFATEPELVLAEAEWLEAETRQGRPRAHPQVAARALEARLPGPAAHGLRRRRRAAHGPHAPRPAAAGAMSAGTPPPDAAAPARAGPRPALARRSPRSRCWSRCSCPGTRRPRSAARAHRGLRQRLRARVVRRGGDLPRLRRRARAAARARRGRQVPPARRRRHRDPRGRRVGGAPDLLPRLRPAGRQRRGQHGRHPVGLLRRVRRGRRPRRRRMAAASARARRPAGAAHLPATAEPRPPEEEPTARQQPDATPDRRSRRANTIGCDACNRTFHHRGRPRGPAGRRLPRRRVHRARGLPRRPARQAGARRGPGRRRQDRAGQGARRATRPQAGPPAVLRGPRRGQGAVRVELPQAAAADPGRGDRTPAGRRSRTTSSARSSCSRGRC